MSMLPLAGAPSECGWYRWHGRKPRFASWVRTFGCVCYPKLPGISVESKVHDQSVRCGYGSRRQQCIAMSSTEAEVIAASQAALELVFLRRLLEEMGEPVEGPTVLYVDNSGAVELSKHHKSCHRSRHVLRRYFKVRELVAEGLIEVRWVDTKSNLADLLSKGTIEPEQYESLRTETMHCEDSGRRFQG